MQQSVSWTVHTVCSDAVMWCIVIICCNWKWSGFGMGVIHIKNRRYGVSFSKIGYIQLI